MSNFEAIARERELASYREVEMELAAKKQHPTPDPSMVERAKEAAANGDCPTTEQYLDELREAIATNPDCDCPRVRAQGKLVCNSCAKRISAEVKEIVDRAFDEAAAELGMTREEYSSYIWGNDQRATASPDNGLPRSLGPCATCGTVPRDCRDA